MALIVVHTQRGAEHDNEDSSKMVHEYNVYLEGFATDNEDLVNDPDFNPTAEFFHDETGTGVRLHDGQGMILSTIVFPKG